MRDMETLDKVFVKDLSIEMLIGIYPNEQQNKQRVIVNLEAWVDSTSSVNDRYEEAVCYESLIRTIESTAHQGHINLVETLAEKIAAACLLNTKIQRVKIRIEKPDVIANASSVGIEITRNKTQNC
jgi:dihydroneopterin aldolase